jgi:hypothetical protein
MRWRVECQLNHENVKSTLSRLSQLFEGQPLFYIERIVFLMKTIVFNSIQVINYWFTLHCTLRLLYQQAQTFSPNIQGISDQNVTRQQHEYSECVRATKNIWMVLDMLWIETIRLKTWYCFYNQYKNNNTAVWKLEFWWLESYKIIKVNLRKENYVLAELNSVKRLIQCQNSDWNHMFFVISLSIMSIIDILMHILKVTAQTSI